MDFRITKNESRNTRMLSIRDVLPQAIKKYNLKQPLTLHMIKQAWPSIIGDSLALNSAPEKISEGVLHIKTKHSVISNEIMMIKNAVLSRLNEKFNVKIKDIRLNIAL